MRLDLFLYETGLCISRSEAKSFIVDGAVTVDGKTVKKPAFEVSQANLVDVDRSTKRYVSRGGLKLEAALNTFGVECEGALALDVGASSGGFTDCLLKHGALRVIAVDSGTSQLVSSLRNDARVVSMENYNARYMTPDDLEYVPTVAVMDVSFISAKLIIPAVYECLSERGTFICLIKPQFEVGRANIGKGGIVKSAKARESALSDVIGFARSVGFDFLGSMISPIEGGDGNIEYLAHFRK